jgi:hypothetical protein
MLDISQVDRSFKTVLIDADSLIYKIGYVVEKDGEYKPEHNEETAKMLLRGFVNDIVSQTSADAKEMFLTKGKHFRFGLAKTHPYKGNRTSPKPISYELLFRELQLMGAKVNSGIEADDAVAMRAHELGLDNVILAFIDKDLKCIGGTWFDYGAMVMKGYITPVEAYRSFYKQMLVGDRVDNIFGVKGIGDVKATKLLENCEDENQMIVVVWAEYLEYFGEIAKDRFLENADLLWLRRSFDDVKSEFLMRWLDEND